MGILDIFFIMFADILSYASDDTNRLERGKKGQGVEYS